MRDTVEQAWVKGIDAHAGTEQLDLLLAGCPEAEWLNCIRALVIRNRVGAAEALLSKAIYKHPESVDLPFALAGLLQHSRQFERAESLLHDILARDPNHVGAAFSLAHLMKDQGRMKAVAATLLPFFEQRPVDVSEIINGVELLDDCNRKFDAVSVCDRAIAAGTTDPRVYAYAAMIEVQLGAFEKAREYYAFLHAHSPQAFEWGMATGLSSSQRYHDPGHPDFELFRHALNQTSLTEKARTTLLFALGKAHDDIGDYASAADYLTQANALAHSTSSWSRKHWRRGVAARLSKQSPSTQLSAATDWTPIFIVGVPRSGSTLLAELLSRHPDICNRGELSWLSKIAHILSNESGNTADTYKQAAAAYEAQARQDDTDAHWFIDKQPFNLLHVDLIMAMWPHARVIHCKRNSRDTALSLWSQPFIDEMQDYTCDFSSIDVVIKDCKKLMAHWQERYSESIYPVNYEQLTANPDACIEALTNWLGLDAHRFAHILPAPNAISTASLWQARQPVHTQSVERWRNYAAYLPDLMRIPQH